MKYRVFALMGLIAMSAGALVQAQDYDDIYYDASKSSSSSPKTEKVTKPAKTTVVYGEVPVKYKEAVQANYSTDRDIDEYNRRGVYDPTYAPSFEVDINGDTIYFDSDTIYEEAFANTRRIERFYNPDIVILSDDDDLVELYYDESPTINLIVGSDWGYGSYYDYGWSSYYPWYGGYGWYSPWRWHSPWYYGYHYWGWGYNPWYYSSWYRPYWGWGSYHMAWHDWGWHDNFKPYRHSSTRYVDTSARPGGHRTGLATNRNTRGRVDATGSNRNGISARNANGSRGTGVGTSSRNRGGYASSRGGNMGSRGSAGVSRPSRSSSSYGGSSSGGSRSSSGSYSSGSRSSGSYSSGGSRSSGSYSSGSHSSSSSSHSSGSYSGGSRGGSSGGGSHGGSSGGGGHRR